MPNETTSLLRSADSWETYFKHYGMLDDPSEEYAFTFAAVRYIRLDVDYDTTAEELVEYFRHYENLSRDRDSARLNTRAVTQEEYDHINRALDEALSHVCGWRDTLVSICRAFGDDRDYICDVRTPAAFRKHHVFIEEDIRAKMAEWDAALHPEVRRTSMRR